MYRMSDYGSKIGRERLCTLTFGMIFIFLADMYKTRKCISFTIKPQKSLKSCLKSFDLTLQFITCLTIQSFYKNDKLINCLLVDFENVSFFTPVSIIYSYSFLIGNTKHQVWPYEVAYIYTNTHLSESEY